MYYKVDKNIGSIFFQAVYEIMMMLFCILHFCILGQTEKMAMYLISRCRNGNVWEKCPPHPSVREGWGHYLSKAGGLSTYILAIPLDMTIWRFF